MANPISQTPVSYIPVPPQEGPQNVALADLLANVTHSGVLNDAEKKFYIAMIQCVATYGIENDRELFNAAGCCFDVHFGSGFNNIITIKNYISIMGGERVEKTLGANEDISSDFFAHNRPGFFLLSVDRNLRFIKEGEDGSLVYYDSQKDAFVDSSSIQVTGEEKLIILNKTKFTQLETYHGEDARDKPVGGKFYHEKQETRKCAIHATHAFLGFPVINETLLSLTQLEKITNATFFSETPNIRRLDQVYLLTQAQISHYKNITRFKLAQTSLYQAEIGSDGSCISLLLKQMATDGLIDKKYSNARLYSMDITHLEVEYAKKRGLLSNDQLWNLDDTMLVLKSVNEDLTKNKVKIDDLNRQIDEMEDRGISLNDLHPLYSLYLDLWEERAPYTSQKTRKDRLDATVQAMKELETEFKRSDRLLILSGTEDHCYAMRKCENGEWVVIDSESPDQTRIVDPLKWLTDRQNDFFQVKETCRYEFISI